MKELFKRLKIRPRDLKLYEIAFLHSSYANEHKDKKDYERLEFLGDALLDLVISEYLYRKSDVDEGKMTKLRAQYVCEDALYEYSHDLGLDKYMKVGHGEELHEDKYKKAIIADLFESFLGAIYLDLGYAKARKVIINIVVPYIEDPTTEFFSDYKSLLQEYVQTKKQSVLYEVIKEDGPAHDKYFLVAAIVDGVKLGVGDGTSKKKAQQAAAKDALDKLALKKH